MTTTDTHRLVSETELSEIFEAAIKVRPHTEDELHRLAAWVGDAAVQQGLLTLVRQGRVVAYWAPSMEDVAFVAADDGDSWERF